MSPSSLKFFWICSITIIHFECLAIYISLVKGEGSLFINDLLWQIQFSSKVNLGQVIFQLPPTIKRIVSLSKKIINAEAAISFNKICLIHIYIYSIYIVSQLWFIRWYWLCCIYFSAVRRFTRRVWFWRVQTTSTLLGPFDIGQQIGPPSLTLVSSAHLTRTLLLFRAL
jgi:hypothetical protein